VHFFGGKNLMHSVLMGNEIIKKGKSKRKSCFIFKVDHERLITLQAGNICYVCSKDWRFVRIGYNQIQYL